MSVTDVNFSRKKKMTRNNKEVTLIELFIVIIIISILATVFISQFDSYRTRSFLKSYHNELVEQKKTTLSLEVWKETNLAKVFKKVGSKSINKQLKKLKSSVSATTVYVKPKQTQVATTEDTQSNVESKPDTNPYIYGSSEGEKITWGEKSGGAW